MGLDMYLEKETYLGANFAHNEVTGTVAILRQGKPVSIKLERLSSVVEQVGYWRKANQIHSWFVENCQGGVDDCNRAEVPYAKLQELRTLCLKVLETKDPTPLPPQAGFFFGSTEIDDGYWQDLVDTVKIIDALEPDGDYYYQSSW